MRRPLTYLFVFVATAIVLDQGGGALLNQLYQRMQSGQSGGRVNSYLKGSFSLLAMGNSRCAHHFNPMIASSNGFNLSHNGQPLPFHIGLAHYILSQDAPDTLLLHLDIYDLMLPVNSSYQAQGSIRHLSYFDNKDPFIRRELNQLNRWQPVKQLSSLYRFNGNVFSVLHHGLLTHAEEGRGFEGHKPTTADSTRVAYGLKQARKTPVQEFERNQNSIRLLDSLRSWCQAADVQLMCFTSPVYSELGEMMPESALNQAEEIMRDLHIPYLNYYQQADSLGLSSPWVWKDAYHLNRTGAEVFSRSLAEDLKHLHFHSSR